MNTKGRQRLPKGRAQPEPRQTMTEQWEPEPLEGRTTVQDVIYLGLRKALMAGRFEPGQMLTMAAVANMFGTSNMPAREALRRLAAENALVVMPNNGSAVVPKVDLDRLDEICRVRVILERSAVELAAVQCSDDDVAELEELARRHREIASSEGAYAMLELNRQFHFRLYDCAQSRVLVQLIETLWLSMGPYMRLMSREIEARMHAGDRIYAGTHLDIITGLKRRDIIFASDAIASDIRATQVLLREVIEREMEPRQLDV